VNDKLAETDNGMKVSTLTTNNAMVKLWF